MNKFFKISVITVLMLAIAIMAFAFTGTSTHLAAGSVCTNVGWNTGAARCGSGPSLSQGLDGLAFRGPIRTPNVGWNT